MIRIEQVKSESGPRDLFLPARYGPSSFKVFCVVRGLVREVRLSQKEIRQLASEGEAGGLDGLAEAGPA